ncbi:hypothetical protein H4219_005420 [Mycoemilia scoparia]|uniref:WD40 repeat-like protein n=1 Tax=Mycoemilia scoparia TaxID=417184 RepID=A0A9W8DQ46_9FUNG|nr:hypothetical protein H4219_005420 [Mycoemilia scoparia]
MTSEGRVPPGPNVTSDPSYLFETTEQIEKRKYLAKLAEDPEYKQRGDPITTGAKVLDMKLAWTDSSNPNVVTLALGLANYSVKVIEVTRDNSNDVINKKGTNRVVCALKGHDGPVTCIGVVPKELTENQQRWVLSGSWDKTIRLWDIKTQKTVAIFNGHSDFIKSLVVDSNRRIFYSGSSDADIRAWKIPDFNTLSTTTTTKESDITTISKSLWVLKHHNRAVDSLELCDLDNSGIPTHLVSAGSEKTINISRLDPSMSSNAAALEYQVKGHKTSVFDVYSDLQMVWSASADKSVMGWDFGGNEIKKDDSDNGVGVLDKPDMVLEHDKLVKSVISLPQVGIVISSTEDGVIRLWDTATSTVKKEIHAHLDGVTKFVFYRGILYSGSLDATVRQWSIKDVMNHREKQYPGPVPFTTSAGRTNSGGNKGNGGSGVELTAEEEAELAELMSSDDE